MGGGNSNSSDQAGNTTNENNSNGSNQNEGTHDAGMLPASIGRLSLLRDLNLADILSLRGLPSTLGGGGMRLASIQIINTSLESLPVHLTALPQLVSLHIQRSNISAETGITIAGLVHLRRLHLSSNPGMAGVVPSPLGRLADLQSLVLSGTGLTTMPRGALDRLVSLRHLDLSGNKLVALPRLRAGLVGLQTLDLSRNRFEAVPSPLQWWAPRLKRLDMTDNRVAAGGGGFTLEAVSEAWKDVDTLRSVALGGNAVCGTVLPVALVGGGGGGGVIGAVLVTCAVV
jgi:Leucine-rich repeat (LRR) protein